MDTWDDDILSDLSDSAFDLPSLEFEDDNSDIDLDEALSDIDLDEALIPALGNKKKPLEVLIDIDQDHKKVVTLIDGNNDLEQVFLKTINADKALSKYAHCTVTFQIFNEKFDTWVDLDRSKALVDGTRLKALFRTQTEVEKGHSHSRKHKKSAKRKRSDSPDVKRKSGKCHQSKKRNLTDDNERKCVTTTTPICNNELNDDMRAATSEQHTQLIHTHSQKLKIHAAVISKENSKEEAVPTEQDSQPVPQGELYCLSLGLSNKNPISALHELCGRLHWGLPVFEIHEQSLNNGVPQFLMKVTLKGQTYIPESSSRKKQLAKQVAAEFCLKKLGILK